MNANSKIAVAVIFGLLSLSGITQGAPDQPILRYKLSVIPEIKKAFSGGDGIEIREITGTRPAFEARGTYRVIGTCRLETLKKAMLYLGNTSAADFPAIVPAPGSSLFTRLSDTVHDFDITFTVRRPGMLHVTIYDEDNHNPRDNSYAGIYLGPVAAR